ncbi:MAG TPA: PH domain-containing protein, partial [Thermomonospora sp.]|nr:PH domain-containing protein [Thermomonospora sp.]
SDVARVGRVADAVHLVHRDGTVIGLGRPRGGRLGGLPVDEVVRLARGRIDEDRPVPQVLDFPPRLASPWALMVSAVPLTAAVTLAVLGYDLWVAVTMGGIAVLWAGASLAGLWSATRITPEGVHNRVLHREDFVRWADVEEVIAPSGRPGQIVIVRRGGGQVPLSAVRGPGPEGLDLAEIVQVIRDRAGTPPPVGAPDVPAGPMTLRSSRRPLLWLVPLTAALVAAIVALGGRPATLLLVLYLCVWVGVLAVWTLRLLRARTDAGPDGIANRRILRTVRLPWPALDRFVIEATLTGTSVRAVRTDGGRVTLAAPHPPHETVRRLRALAQAHGGGPAAIEDVAAGTARTLYTGAAVFLAGLAVYLWSPWLEPWWPGRAEARSLPSACAVGAPHAARLVPGAAGEPGAGERFSAKTAACRWSGGGPGAELELSYALFERGTDQTATDAARDDMATSLDGVYWGEGVRVPGVGDLAVQVIEEGQERWLVRTANVVIELRHSASGDAVRADPDVAALVRAAVTSVSLR